SRSAKSLLTKASAGSARSSTAGSTKPGSSSIGTSLSECTAQSASPRSIAISSSLRNRPLPPIAASERSSTSSPRVLSGTSTTSRPGGAAGRRAAPCALCHRARGLFRVAMRRVSMRALSVMAACRALRGPLATRAPLGLAAYGASSGLLQGLAQLRHAAPADLERGAAAAQQRVHVAVRGALELGQFAPGHQAVAVDAHEQVAELLLQRLQRLLDQVLAAGVVHDHVLLLG